MILLVPRDVINRGLLVKDGMGNTERVAVWLVQTSCTQYYLTKSI